MSTRRRMESSLGVATVTMVSLLAGCDLMRMVRDTSQGIKDTNVQLREASGLIRLRATARSTSTAACR
jgi:hypothetical protein